MSHLALITLAMAARWIPRDQRPATPRVAREAVARIDVAGVAGFGCAMLLDHAAWW